MSRLQVAGLGKDYGGVTVLQSVSFEVQPGERRGIIGPNGAGKTTLFKLITGEVRPTRGRVLLDGRDVTALPVHARVNLGLGQTFQRNNLFPALSVLDHVRLALQRRGGRAWRWPVLRPIRADQDLTAEAEALLASLSLHAQRHAPAHTLAYGQQRALEVAVALATQPRLLLLDEPTAGMSPAETAEIVRFIAALPRDLTLLIVEHDMDAVFSLAEQLTVLHVGEVIADGPVADVRADPRVQAIYLGTGI
jgi:branched-chain amino acid transport system ATP-binding protein